MSKRKRAGGSGGSALPETTRPVKPRPRNSVNSAGCPFGPMALDPGSRGPKAERKERREPIRGERPSALRQSKKHSPDADQQKDRAMPPPKGGTRFAPGDRHVRSPETISRPMTETNDVRERMQEVARTISVILPPHTGFIVLAFDFGQANTRLEYVANCKREEALKVLKAFVARCGEPNNWCKIEP